MYLINNRLGAPSQPGVISVRRQAAVEGPIVPSTVLRPEEAAALHAKAQAAQAANPAVQNVPAPPSAAEAPAPAVPSEAELEATLVRYGVEESKARAMLAQHGPVKINALIEHEKKARNEALRAAGSGSAPNSGQRSGGSGGDSTSPDTASGASSSGSESAGPDPSGSEPVNPYKQLKDAYAAGSPWRSEEELQEYRRRRFASYVDSVHAGEKEVLHNAENDSACTSESCSAQSSAH